MIRSISYMFIFLDALFDLKETAKRLNITSQILVHAKGNAFFVYGSTRNLFGSLVNSKYMNKTIVFVSVI